MEVAELTTARIAVIGGSGLYEMSGLHDVVEKTIETPFGLPSDSIVVGAIEGIPVAFLPRHGRGHRFSPTEVNYRANIFALKTLGVERIISVSAVGSLREDYHPLDVVIPDQLFDRTLLRPRTFYGNGIVAHASMADPFCPDLSKALFETALACDARAHFGGTYVCIEGPQFSTRAESSVFRKMGADVIGMTALPEARLAREAEICYGTLAFVTDYDVWHESAGDVTVEMVVANLMRNVTTAQQVIRSAVRKLADSRECDCGSAMATAIITDRAVVPEQRRQELAPLLSKYLG